MKVFLSAICACAFSLLSAGGSSAQQVTLAWIPNPQTPQIDVAMQKGFFKDAGLDIKVVSFATGRESFEALVGGQIDFAFMAEFPATVGAARAQPFSVIADLSRFKSNKFIGNGAAVQLKSLQELNGKKVGITIGTNFEYFASRALSRGGVRPTIINAAPSDLVPALARGDIDAAVPFPTFYQVASKVLGSNYRELISSDYVLHNIISASSQVIKSRPEVVERFMAALLKADQLVQTDQPAAEAAVVTSLKGALTQASIHDVWSDYDFGVVLRQDLVDLMADQAAWLSETGAVKGKAPTAEALRGFIADGFLKKLKPAAVQIK